jgi:hypothetical protein
LSTLSALALISGIYDVAVGISLTAGRPLLQSLFQLPAPIPPIHADLNALFVTTVGIGYWWPYRDPARYRWYLWLMGPVLKGAGAAVFVVDHLLRGSPQSFLLFALCDGALALVTLYALLRER